jgi:hypothetical protein
MSGAASMTRSKRSRPMPPPNSLPARLMHGSLIEAWSKEDSAKSTVASVRRDVGSAARCWRYIATHPLPQGMRVATNIMWMATSNTPKRGEALWNPPSCAEGHSPSGQRRLGQLAALR